MSKLLEMILLYTLLASAALWIIHQFVNRLDAVIFQIARVAVIVVYAYYILMLFGVRL